jgi:hypothetical protein
MLRTCPYGGTLRGMTPPRRSASWWEKKGPKEVRFLLLQQFLLGRKVNIPVTPYTPVVPSFGGL